MVHKAMPLIQIHYNTISNAVDHELMTTGKCCMQP